MYVMRIAAWVSIVTVILAFLMLAQDFLIPLVVAACIWFIISSLSNLIAKIHIGRYKAPPWLSRILALFVIVGAFFGSVEIIIGSVNGMMEAAPLYQKNLEHMFGETMHAIGVEQTPTFNQLLDQ